MHEKIVYLVQIWLCVRLEVLHSLFYWGSILSIWYKWPHMRNICMITGTLSHKKMIELLGIVQTTLTPSVRSTQYSGGEKNTQLHLWDKHKRVIHITQWTMSMYIVHGVLLSPLYRLFSLILPWRAFKLSTYHCKTWIHITKMQLMKLYPSLYQELFQNTLTSLNRSVAEKYILGRDIVIIFGRNQLTWAAALPRKGHFLRYLPRRPQSPHASQM